jgi:hypothetical protein
MVSRMTRIQHFNLITGAVPSSCNRGQEMSRKKDREKAAKRTANQPAWERFSADVQGLSSIEAAKTLLANPPPQDSYASQLHANLRHFIDAGFKRPPGAEPKEGRLYRAFFINIASDLPPEQRARAAAELAAWLGDT